MWGEIRKLNSFLEDKISCILFINSRFADEDDAPSSESDEEEDLSISPSSSGRRAALEKWKQKLGYQNYDDTVHGKFLVKRILMLNDGSSPIDKLSPSQQSVYGGRGDPQTLPQGCAAAGATDDIDHCRKRKSATTQDEGNVSSVIST